MVHPTLHPTHYPALVTVEDDIHVVVFPSAPGCQTQAEPDEDVDAVAQEALEGWLEAEMARGGAPPRPKAPSAKQATAPGVDVRWIAVSPRLGLALQLRWARLDAALSQAQLAERLGVSRQLVSQLESPDANPTLETVERAAAALGRRVDATLAVPVHV